LDEVLAVLSDELADRYTVDRPVGKGGMATVYLAQERHPQRHVAIKVLDPKVSDQIGRERFLREVEIASQLTHPHIVPIFSAGEAGGLMYYVMPYIGGPSLRKRLVNDGALSLGDALHIAHDVADALEYAHDVGIVHRDVKPENILLAGGHALVTDFGIARALCAACDDGPELTIAGLAIGTPGYMSPEQATGGGVDARTDIYSLGCVLYEMLYGERPVMGRELKTNDSGAVDTVPDAVHHVLRRALMWDAADRYPSTREFAEALAQVVPSPGPHTAQRFTPPPNATPQQVIPAKSLAVLPFANLSPDPENEYFSDGITDDIIAHLSKIADLKVTSRTSVMQYKQTDKNLRQIGHELAVAHVLEGSVRRAGNRVRIVSQLIDTQTDAHIWAETYDRDLTDIFAIQTDVAEQIGKALQATLSPGVEDSIKRKPTDDLEAYNLYLQGMYHWHQFTPDGNAKARLQFEEAIARDSQFALAYSGLANTYFSAALGAGEGLLGPHEAFPYAREAAERALELDGAIADAQATLGSVHFWFDWDWGAAQEAFDRACDLGCGSQDPTLKYGFFLAGMGRREEGIAMVRRARDLDPVSLIVNTHVGHHYYWARQPDQAKRHFTKTLELSPHFPPARFGLGWNHLVAGEVGAAREHFEWGLQSGGRHHHAIVALACAQAAAGRTADAERGLRDLLDRKASDEEYVSSREIALAYTWMGDTAAALDWLERAYAERAAWMSFLNVDPIWDRLRGEARFRDLIAQIGFEPVPAV
jgi:serine/threonine-protein kinase